MVEYTLKQNLDLMRATLNTYTEARDNTGGNVLYLGVAAPGTLKASSGWRIQKWSYDGNGLLSDIQWADGTNEFTKVWDDRATYNYS